MFIQLDTDGGIQLLEAMEDLIAQGRVDSPVRHAHSILHAGLVPGFTHSCGQDGAIVVLAKTVHRFCKFRLIPAGSCYHRAHIVRFDTLGNATVILDRVGKPFDKVLLLLRRKRFYIRVFAIRKYAVQYLARYH